MEETTLAATGTHHLHAVSQSLLRETEWQTHFIARVETCPSDPTYRSVRVVSQSFRLCHAFCAISLLTALGGCSPTYTSEPPMRRPVGESPATEGAHAPEASRACIGLGSENECGAPPAQAGERSVTGDSLATCSLDPRTGFFRTGACETGPHDRGIHVVCAEMTEAFLTTSRARGNDLITPRPELGFAGLREGDRWCLCAARWAEALRAGVAPPVVLEATHERALEFLSEASLLDHALRDEDSPSASPRP